jgi:hypothetical protein
MPTATRQDFTVRAGETRPVEWTVLDEDGAEVDVAGEHVVLRIARHLRATHPNFLVDLNEDDAQITISDSGSGTFSVIRYDPSLTDLTLPGRHWYQVAVVQSGADARIVAEGVCEITNAIALR